MREPDEARVKNPPLGRLLYFQMEKLSAFRLFPTYFQVLTAPLVLWTYKRRLSDL